MRCQQLSAKFGVISIIKEPTWTFDFKHRYNFLEGKKRGIMLALRGLEHVHPSSSALFHLLIQLILCRVKEEVKALTAG